MSKIKSTQCPSCGEFVPDNTIKVTTKDGKKYHEGCAKEIASLYLALSMKSGNIKPKAGKKSGKNKRTPQKTQQVKNDSQANTSA